MVKIDSWINNNPFGFDYVSDSPLPFKVKYGNDIDKMTFEVLSYIQYAFAVLTGNPKVSFEEIMRITQAKTSLSKGLVGDAFGRTASSASLLDAKSKLEDALKSEKDSVKKSVYSNMISVIDYFVDYIDLKNSESYLNLLKRPTQKSLRSIFNHDENIRKYLITNIIARDLGFDPLFFDYIGQELFDKNTATGMYALHHKFRLRSWSIYTRDLLITSQVYHNVYDSMAVSEKDVEVVSQGIQMLIEIGLENYKKGIDPPITKNDILKVFLQLGGGKNQYVLTDGRTVIEWWEQGSTARTRVQSAHTFSDRLEGFNDRIKFLADNKKDYKAWIDHYYNKYAADWLSKHEVTLNMYESMSRNLNSKRLLHQYLHLEDINLIRELWKVW